MKRLVLALAAALVAAAAGLAAAPTAGASSQGCTYTQFPTQYVCFDIEGSGLHVDRFRVIRAKLDADNSICNYRARVTVRNAAGTVVFRKWSKLRRGCDVFRVTRTFNVNRNFPNHSEACGSFFEDGVLQDTACNEIKR